MTEFAAAMHMAQGIPEDRESSTQYLYRNMPTIFDYLYAQTSH